MDDKQRIALVETRTLDTQAMTKLHDNSSATSSATTSARRAWNWMRRRKSFPTRNMRPTGSSTYQAVRTLTETAKRYRYTAKERDDETGLYYHGRGITRRGWEGG